MVTSNTNFLTEEEIARVRELIEIGRKSDEEAAELALSGNLASNKIYARYKELRARSAQCWEELEKIIERLPNELVFSND